MMRARHHLRPALAALLSGVLLSACAAPKPVTDGAGGRAAPSDANVMPASLEGTAWVLAELPARGPLTGQPATARFESGRVLGTDGCNRYSAPFTVTGSMLEIRPGGAMTMMACPPDVMAQAQAFREALEQARRFRIVEGRLELTSANGAMLAVMAAQSMGLVGAWEVVALNNGRQAVVGVLEDAPLDMTLSADGTVAGSAGCNRFTTTFEAEGNAIRFGPAATTRRTCPGEGVMEQETAFLQALATVATVRVEGDSLEFRTTDDALALMMRRLPAR